MVAADALSPEQMNTLQHALGLDQYGQGSGWRNRYACLPGDPVVDSLVRLGLMKDLGEWKITDGEHAYVVTDAGKQCCRDCQSVVLTNVALCEDCHSTRDDEGMDVDDTRTIRQWRRT